MNLRLLRGIRYIRKYPNHHCTSNSIILLYFEFVLNLITFTTEIIILSGSPLKNLKGLFFLDL